MRVRLVWTAMVFVMFPLMAIGAGYTGSFRIVEYHIDQGASGDWNLWIKPDPQPTAAITSCTNKIFVVLPMNYDHSQERYAAVLAAFTAGKNIEVYIDGCYGTAPNDYPLVDRSRFKIAE